MSVNSYLQNLASNLVLSHNEKEKITTSNKTLKKRLGFYNFQENILEKNVFGSYTRETILPRKYDEKSDKTYININTLEELTNLSKKIKVDIIFDGDDKILEIYDDYRE